MPEENDYSEDQHPALKGFNRPVEMVKHVANKIVKNGLLGAAVGALAMVAVGTIVGAATVAAIPVVGIFLAPLAGTLGATFAAGSTGLLVAGAIVGAKIGGLIGAFTGISGASDAVEDKAQPAEGEGAETEDRSGMKYRKQRRGGKGLRDIKTTERNGRVVGILALPACSGAASMRAASSGVASPRIACTRTPMSTESSVASSRSLCRSVGIVMTSALSR